MYLIKHKDHTNGNWYVLMSKEFETIRSAKMYAKREYPQDEIEIKEL